MKAAFTEAGYHALVEDIFRRFPSVQKEGFAAGAYKPGLERQMAFEEALGHPSRQFRSIHIAGTNGKGSVANMLASALSSCGLKTGLFTSPHLIDFRERMVIAEAEGDAPSVTEKKADVPSGASPSVLPHLIPQEYVFDFLTEWLPWCTEHGLSFFEITTGLAFRWFADEKVDVAVVETGLGGRLDSTNILERPDLTIITSIGLDHMAQLGDTLPKIAAEKAGIFKKGSPVLIGERSRTLYPVFEERARKLRCRIGTAFWPMHRFPYDHEEILAAMDLQADVQENNLRTVLSALIYLREQPGYEALSNAEAIVDGIVHTARNMGFHGRWERLQERPLVIADIGHNAHALKHNFAQLEALNRPLIIVYGIMADKDLDAILPLFPEKAQYIFTTPNTPRALPAEDLLRRFLSAEGDAPSVTEKKADVPSGASPLVIQNVREAVKKALALATPETVIYIGGSTYVVSEALPLFQGHNN